ncbi:MAG: PilZ domain-containing protein [Deltaproteobacteria bacterium]|nr:MAG: PilZ domain-containing protein [Deltaproteobacteria bacterium]
MAAPRIRTAIGARFATQRFKGQGRIKNLGEHGLFVRTSQLPEAGETVHVSFTFPSGEKVWVVGVVWWTTASLDAATEMPSGFGLRLLDDDDTYRQVVARLLD